MFGRYAVALCALVLLFTAPVRAQEGAKAEKEAAIRRLLVLNDTVKQSQRTMDMMFTLGQQQNPSVPTEVWTRLREKVKAEELVEKLIPLYDKYYTMEDITGLIAFAESPLGRKVTATMPLISQEGAAIGQKWAMEKVEELRAEMEAKETTPKKAPTKPAPKTKTNKKPGQK